jgi:outer membrane protein TolC
MTRTAHRALLGALALAEEAIRLARLAQPSVVQARGAARNADAQARAAFGAYLPDLTATTTGTRSYTGTQRVGPTGELENATTTSVNFGLRAGIDLFTGFRRGADRRAARASQSAADAGLIDTEFQADLTTTQQFFDALAAQQLVRVREASVRRAEEQLNLSTAKLRVGSATRSDSLRSLVNLGNARLALVSAESDVARTQATLARTLGRDGRVAAEDDSAFYAATVSLDTASLNQEARNRSPRIIAATANAEAADASVKASRSQYYPTLGLSASANWSGNNQSDYDLSASRQLQLGLSWPIFNRFQREQGVVNALTSLDNAEAQAADSRRAVLANLRAAIASLEAARLTISITQTSVLAAEEDLRVQQERYRLGAATIVDVLTSQVTLDDAEVAYIRTRLDFLVARAELAALLGREL